MNWQIHGLLWPEIKYGKSCEAQDAGYCARVWQHEFDHLNGTLIIDRMTPMDRLVTRKAIKSLHDSYKEA